MIRVCIESPLRGAIAINCRYADACQLDSFARGEAPFLGHLQYPRVLDDTNPIHREWGIDAHLTWLRAAERVAVYVDLGLTDGMTKAILLCEREHIPYEYRRIGADWESFLVNAARPTPGFR